MRTLLALLLVAGAAAAQTIDSRAPSSKARGRVYRWSHNGFDGLYHVPKEYNAKRGATLLMMFYGKDGRTYSEILRWSKNPGFSDVMLLHPGDLKPASNNRKRGTVEYAPDEVLAGLCHGLRTEFGKRVKVNATYVVGAGEGGAFALYYAALYPKQVHGVMAEMPAYWKKAPPVKEQVHQAILVTRSTSCGGGFYQPVPFEQTDRIVRRLTKAELPRLRFLIQHVLADNPPDDSDADMFAPVGWRGQLGWCEAMTLDGAAQLKTSFDHTCAEIFDYAALYRAAQRVRGSKAPKSAKDQASKVIFRVERLANRHIRALKKSVAQNKRLEFDGRDWVAHLPAFLDGFRGVPACDTLATEWASNLARHKRAAKSRYAKLKSGKPMAGFAAAADIVRHGCLDRSLYVSPYAERLIVWRRKADRLRLRKPDVAVFDKYLKARRAGLNAYDSLNAKY